MCMHGIKQKLFSTENTKQNAQPNAIHLIVPVLNQWKHVAISNKAIDLHPTSSGMYVSRIIRQNIVGRERGKFPSVLSEM